MLRLQLHENKKNALIDLFCKMSLINPKSVY